jgi:hypothetical protein
MNLAGKIVKIITFLGNFSAVDSVLKDVTYCKNILNHKRRKHV